MWMDIAIAALFVAGIHAFVQLAGWRTPGRDPALQPDGGESVRPVRGLAAPAAAVCPAPRRELDGRAAQKGEAPPSMSWRGLTCGLAANGRRFLGFH